MSAFRVQRVGRIAKTISGSGFPPDYQGRDFGDLPFAKVSDISRASNSGGITTAANYVSYADQRALGARIIPAQSVIFPKVGAALLGNARAITLTKCLIDNNLMAVVPREGDVRYWKYVLLTIDLGELSGSGPLPYISDTQVRDLRIPFPSLDEQRRIADFLDAETARIDALVDQKRQVIALIDERIQALVNKITPGEMVSGVDGRPIGITGMQCVRLGAIAEVHGGFTMDAGRDTTSDSVTLPYLRVANVQDGALALDDVKEVTLPRALTKRCTLRPGDVLMTEGGDPDKLGRGTVWPGDIEPCLHQNAIFAVRPNPQLLPEYLAMVTRTRYARAYFEMTASKATGIAHTSSTKITSFRVPMLAIAEQHQVILDIQEALARIDALRAPAERQLALLAERRQALITAAVTGGITV